MDNEVDSLDQIISIIHSKDRGESWINSGYQTVQSSENHASSFDAGGQLPRVVDPEFRPPTTSISSSQQFGLTLDAMMNDPSLASINNPPQNNRTVIMNANHMTTANVTNSTVNNIAFSTSNQNTNSASIDKVYSSTPDTNVDNQSASSTSNIPDITSSNSSSNLNTGSTINLDSIPLPISNQLTRPTGIAHFSIPEKTTSFSDLAKQSSNDIATSSNIGFSTLQEYGPPVSSKPMYIHPHPHTVNQHERDMSYGSQPYMGLAPQQNYFGTNSTYGMRHQPQTNFQPHVPLLPTTGPNIVPASQPIVFIPSTNPVNSVPSGSFNVSAPTNSQPLYSPPVSSSPPLDDINMNLVSPDQSSNSQKNPNRIPRTSEPLLTNDKYDGMNLLSLQKKYREFEAQLRDINNDRQDIERGLNDMTRKNHGKNIELDPVFRQKKDKQKLLNEQHAYVNSEKRIIFERLLSKYHYRMVPQTFPPAVAPQPRRAKMSTAAPTPRDNTLVREQKDDKIRRQALDLKDFKTWCQICDDHFDSLKEYCDHLHSRTHLRAMKKSTPWRGPLKNPLDKRKTYDIIKSICAKLSNELKAPFNVKDLDHVLNPLKGDKEKSLHSIGIGREQGKFDDQDRLFSLKGYDHLTPISGYYCTLCNRTLCDTFEAEQHLKGYDHNYAYAKCVALNPKHEALFKTQQDKSYAKQFGKEPPKESSRSPSKQAASSSSAPASNPPPAQQYKKATSHIVDQHEVIADKFTQKKTVAHEKGPTVPTQRSESDKRTVSSEGVRKKISSAIPEIVPLGSCQPSALKRLRNQPTVSKTKTSANTATTSSTSSESPEPSQLPASEPNEVQIVSEIHLNAGDPDSPFPELDLGVTGNTHVSLLKDKRLAGPCKIVLEKLDLGQWQDHLMEETTLWTRVAQMMAKKEPAEFEKSIQSKKITRPTYFSASGAPIPVVIGEDGSEEMKVEEKPKLSDLISDKSYSNPVSDNQKIDGVGLGLKETELDHDSDMFGDSKSDTENHDFDMADLEKFFCQ